MTLRATGAMTPAERCRGRLPRHVPAVDVQLRARHERRVVTRKVGDASSDLFRRPRRRMGVRSIMRSSISVPRAASMIAVSTKPGWTEFTRTPSSAHPIAAVLVIGANCALGGVVRRRDAANPPLDPKMELMLNDRPMARCLECSRSGLHAQEDAGLGDGDGALVVRTGEVSSIVARSRPHRPRRC